MRDEGWRDSEAEEWRDRQMEWKDRGMDGRSESGFWGSAILLPKVSGLLRAAPSILVRIQLGGGALRQDD